MGRTADNFYFSTPDEAEAAFYSAFEMADINLMHALIADNNVSCIHPNAMPILGRAAVLDSWNIILISIDEPAFYTEVLHRTFEGDEVGNTAIHIVEERIAANHHIGTETSLVIATNIYIRQENGWRMMMHHTSLPPYVENEAIENDPTITHNGPLTMQ